MIKYYAYLDYSEDDETSEESEDEISTKMESLSNVYQETTDGFNLGIDCNEIPTGDARLNIYAFCYKEPLNKEPTCRKPKCLKNLYYGKRIP